LKKLSIHIVEGEIVIALNLIEMLTSLGHNIESTSINYDDFLENLSKSTSDLFIVDIQLNGKKNGIDVAMELDKRNIPHIYISSQTNEEVLNCAKKTNAYGYIIKPFDVHDINVAIEMASGRMEKEKETQSIFINSGTGKFHVLLNDILYAEADGNYTHIHTKDRVYTLRGNLKTIHGTLLTNNKFKRVHKSFVVNTNVIEKVMKSCLILENGVQIPIRKGNK